MAHRKQTVARCGSKLRWVGLLFAVWFLAAGCNRAPKSCQVCLRDECHGITFRVTLNTGKTVETCCPRCALAYLKTAKQQPQSLAATDLANARWMDATKAVYISGSDVSPCAKMAAYRDAYGCCALKDFDRCSPSLIAFASTSSAREFQKQHGGELVTWATIQPTK